MTLSGASDSFIRIGSRKLDLCLVIPRRQGGQFKTGVWSVFASGRRGSGRGIMRRVRIEVPGVFGDGATVL